MGIKYVKTMWLHIRKEKQMSLFKKRGDGFTLVEVMVALVIISVGVIPLILFLPATTATLNRSSAKSQDVALAEKLSEDIKIRLTNSFTSISNGTGSGAFTDNADYRYATMISDSPTDKGQTGEVKVIRVTVFADRDRDGSIDPKESPYTLWTKFAKRN